MNFNPASLYFLINQHGKDITYTCVTTEPTYNTATGTYDSAANTVYTVRGYFYNYKLEEVNGTNIVMGDRKLLLKPTDTSGNIIPEPKIADLFDGTSVKSADKIYSGTSVMCYICQVGE
jgi:hypothetical protein